MYSVKNLRDVIILTIFMLAVFALLGLQVYMGVLSQVEDNPRFYYELTSAKNVWHLSYSHSRWHALVHSALSVQICIKDFQEGFNGSTGHIDTDYYNWTHNESNFMISESTGQPIMCGNSSGAGACPEHSTCLKVHFEKMTGFFLSMARITT